MAIKSDKWIRTMATEKRMIEPFLDHQVRDGVISYGLSSYGYDMRLSDRFRIFSPTDVHMVLDPKQSQQGLYRDYVGGELILEPGQFALGQSIEYFRIPRNVITIAYGKSTYARSGIVCNLTPFEPEWEGYVTIMITNAGRHPAKIYANEGIAQVLFLESDEACETSYADRQGKYQAQKQITHSRL